MASKPTTSITPASPATGAGVTNTYSGQTRTWHARITYSVTETATSCTVSLDGNMYVSNVGSGAAMGINANRATATFTGDVSGSWTNTSDKAVMGQTPWSMLTKPLTVSKTHATQSKSATFKIVVASASAWDGTSSTAVSISVPARWSYTVSYNVNGGSGSIGSQTKWHDESLSLTTSKPTRQYYTFKGWATTQARANAGTVDYASGGSFTTNADTTLWAVWQKTDPNFRTKVNGAWKNGVAYVKVNGAWKAADTAYVKVNGAWKEVERT